MYIATYIKIIQTFVTNFSLSLKGKVVECRNQTQQKALGRAQGNPVLVGRAASVVIALEVVERC